MVSKLWSDTGRRTVSTLLNKQVQQVDVPSVPEDQPFNPFNEIHVLSGHQDIVNILTIIDDIRLASSGDDNLVFIWGVENVEQLHCLQGHTRPVTSMLVHQQNNIKYQEYIQVLITASSDKTIRIWHCDEGTCLNTIQDHCSTVKCLVKFNQDFMFCSGGEDLCLWDVQGQLLFKEKQPSPDADVQFILPIKNERLVIAFSKPSLAIYSIMTTIAENKTVNFHSRLPPHREDIRCLVNVSDDTFASASLDGEIIIWSSINLEALHKFNKATDFEGVSHVYPYSVQHMMVVHQRFLFATVGAGFALFDTTTGKCLAARKNAHHSKVTHVELLVESFRCVLATCSQDGTVRLWGSSNRNNIPGESSSVEMFLGESMSGKRDTVLEPELLGECRGHSGSVRMISNFGDEGFASCASDGLIILWKDGCYHRQKRMELATSLLFSPLQ